MKEKDFQKLNKQLLKKQKQVAKEREKQSPAKISEAVANCSTLKNESAEEVKTAKRCERCGKTDCELITPTEGCLKRLCLVCEAERQEYLARQRERAIEENRAFRRQRRDYLRSRIESIIPKAYQQARLRHLGHKFKRELLNYDKTTGIVLYGPTGTGKTYALCALLRSLIASGLKCERIGYEELCLMIRDTFKSQSLKSELNILDKYRKIDVLIIEDLGSSKPIGTAESDFSLRVIYVLINSRLEGEQLTLVSTNKTLANLKASFDERIASRLSTMRWIGCGGSDKRAKNGKV